MSASPRQNHLLAALPAEEYERLRPHLELVELPRGWMIHGAGSPENHLYFITRGIVSRCYVMADGASAAYAVTGSEGVIGVASFLGGESTTTQAVVVSAGDAFRLRADLLKREFARNAALSDLLLRYTLALIAQTGQIAACNRHHSLEQRMCRLILSCADRLHENDVTLTQELMAGMLGVRREGVTQAAGDLEQAGMIECSRGHIALLDRRGLEAMACECYAVIKRDFRRPLRQGIPLRTAFALN